MSYIKFPMIAAVAILGVCAFYVLPQKTTDALLPPAFAQSDDQSTDNQPQPEVVDYVLGDPDAPVTVIEYSSFTCSYCGAFHVDGFAKLKADYIDTGKVKFINREVYFDRYGLWAAMLARCGGDTKYYGITDLLYKSQRNWSNADTDRDVIDRLYDIGRIAGLTDEQMDACYSDAAMAKAMVDTYQENATKDGIRATPTFIIDGQVQANASYDVLSGVIDKALGQ